MRSVAPSLRSRDNRDAILTSRTTSLTALCRDRLKYCTSYAQAAFVTALPRLAAKEKGGDGQIKMLPETLTRG